MAAEDAEAAAVAAVEGSDADEAAAAAPAGPAAAYARSVRAVGELDAHFVDGPPAELPDGAVVSRLCLAVQSSIARARGWGESVEQLRRSLTSSESWAVFRIRHRRGGGRPREPRETPGHPDARCVRVSLADAFVVIKGYRVPDPRGVQLAVTENVRRSGLHVRVRSTEGGAGSWSRRFDADCPVACDDTAIVLASCPVTDAMLDFAVGCTWETLRR